MTLAQELQTFGPLITYDKNTGRPVGSREIIQVGYEGDVAEVMVIESSDNIGFIKQRLIINPSEIEEILNAPAGLSGYGISQTRDQMNSELERWCEYYPTSKLFINNSDSLPLISLGKLKENEEEKNSAVAGKLCMVCDELADSLKLGENRYAFFIGNPNNYLFIKSDVMNMVGILEKLNADAVVALSRLFNAVNRVYFKNGVHEFGLFDVIENLSRQNHQFEFDFVEDNGIEYAIVDDSLVPHLNRGISKEEIEQVHALLNAHQRLEEEFEIKVHDILTGAGEICYGLGLTEEYGTILSKGVESIPYLPAMKKEHLEMVKDGYWKPNILS